MIRDHMLGQFLELPGAWPRAAPVPGALRWLVVVLVVGLAPVVVLPDEVAAFAIAAPPPATAAVTASVVRSGLIR